MVKSAVFLNVCPFSFKSYRARPSGKYVNDEHPEDLMKRFAQSVQCCVIIHCDCLWVMFNESFGRMYEKLAFKGSRPI